MKNRGFTIVELLVVIVVIGILAAITIVAYTGISQKAVSASLQSDLDNASKQLKLYQVEYGSFPATMNGSNCPTAPVNDPKYCLKISNGNSYIYNVSSTNPQVICVTATNGTKNYMITAQSSPVLGGCPSYNGLVLYLDAAVADSYPGTGTTWTDLSGSGKNGTLINGVGYTTVNGEALSFNGGSYVQNSGGGFLPIGDSTRTIMFWYEPNVGMTDANGAFTYGCSGPEGPGCATQGVGRYFMAWANTTNIGLHLQTCQVTGPNTPSPVTGWHLYTAVFNGNNTITYYTDGSNATTVTPSCTINTTTGTGYAIGQSTAGYYNGSISVVNVYNRALTSSEITQNFNATKSRYGL